MGVSRSFLSYRPFTGGGAGRANGFGGPVAPALSKAPALGDGGGRTTPACPSRIGVICAAAVAWGDVSPVALSSPESSFGICTFSLGRLGSACTLFVRLGGIGVCMLGITGVEAVRCGNDGEWRGPLV